jgi:ABC-type multidrug transport system fused ATPase/permease subunit
LKNVKKLFALVRPLRWTLVFMAFFILFQTAVQTIKPWLYKYMVDNAADLLAGTIDAQTAYQNLFRLAVIFFILFFLLNVIRAIHHYFAAKLVSESNRLISEKIFEHLKELSIDYFESEKIGKIHGKLQRGIGKATSFLDRSTWVFSFMLSGIAALVVIAIIDWQIGLIMLVSALIFIYSTIRLNKKIEHLHKEINKRSDEIHSHVFEVMSGMHIVKSFVQEEKELSLFRSRNKEYIKLILKRATKRRNFWFLRFGLLDFTRSLVVVMAGFKAIRGEISPGDIVLFSTYVNFLMDPLSQIVGYYDDGVESLKSVDDIVEVLETEPEIKDSENAFRFKKVQGDIKFKNVSFSYNDKKEVLKSINFSVNKGQSLALVGPSGVGKTTITKLLMRFYQPTEGKIYVDSQDIEECEQRSLRNNIAVVPQEILLFNETIKYNISYGRPEATDVEIIEAAKAANIHNFINSLPEKYETFVGERGIRLSGGEKQRIAIARAILKNPSIIILDEATSHLDSESERLVQEALWRLIKGRTTIIIAHRLATVMKADNIIVLDSGQIVEGGSHQKLIKASGLYAKLFNIQSGSLLDLAK